MYVCIYIVGAFSFCSLHKACIEELVSECKRGRERESKGKSVRAHAEQSTTVAEHNNNTTQHQQSNNTTQQQNNRAQQHQSTSATKWFSAAQQHNTSDGAKEAREVRVQVSLTLIVRTIHNLFLDTTPNSMPSIELLPN